MQDDDARLIAALSRGDADAFAALVDRHSRAMIRVAMAYVPSRAAAEEVVQETWIAVMRGIDGFEGLLMLSDAATGTTLVVTFWESEEVAQRHGEARRQFRESITAAVKVNVVDTGGYELTFSHLGPWAAERADS